MEIRGCVTVITAPDPPGFYINFVSRRVFYAADEVSGCALQMMVNGALMNSRDQNDRAARLKGHSAKCSGVSEGTEQPWRLVLLGALGVGKGTQADRLTRRLGASRLSTGDVFREARTRSEREQTLAMASALNFTRRGALVPDAIVWELIRERTSCLRCRGGFVLDGFPHTLAQAHALNVLLESEGLFLNAVINNEVPVTEIKLLRA